MISDFLIPFGYDNRPQLFDGKWEIINQSSPLQDGGGPNEPNEPRANTTSPNERRTTKILTFVVNMATSFGYKIIIKVSARNTRGTFAIKIPPYGGE
jgi:hypothetical protein